MKRLKSGNSRIVSDAKRPPSNLWQQGFTIVEVLIVLAIAGLLMLLMFEALPIFERNGRNNQRKQDVAGLLDAVSRYELNNSAQFPTNVTQLLNSARVTLSHYDPTTGVSLNDNQTGTKGPETDVDTVAIYDYQRCDPTTPGTSSSNGAEYTDIVALYAIETGGAPAGQCLQL